MTKYTELEDMLKYAEVGDTIYLKSSNVCGSNCGVIETFEDYDYSGYNLWFERDSAYGDTESDKTIKDLIEGYYDSWYGQIELIKGNEYVHIYNTLVDVMKQEAKVGYLIEMRGNKNTIGEIVSQCYGYNVKFRDGDYGDDYPYTDLKQLIQDYYDTWSGQISLLIPRNKKEEKKFQQEYNNDFFKTTEDYIARQIYEQFKKDDPTEFYKVRKQILKYQEITYFRR